MKLHVAQAIAAKLLKTLCPDRQGFVVGSVRRNKPEPNDIELLLPWYDEGDDPVYDRLSVMCGVTDQLFGKAGARPMFKAIRGVVPGFRSCRVRCEASNDDRWPARLKVPDFEVDLFRYDRGPDGNLGWMMLLRTGPEDFSNRVLTRYKQQVGQGSRGGYLLDQAGRPVATPNEYAVFEALGIQYIEPEQRDGARLRSRQHIEPLTAEEIPF